MHLGDIMEPSFPTLYEDDLVEKAVEAIVAPGIQGVVVLDKNNKVTGFLAENDIIRTSFPNYLMQMEDISFVSDFMPFYKNLRHTLKRPIKDLMNQAVCLKKETSILEAAFLFLKKKFYVIPIVDAQKNLLGVVTRDSILSLTLQHAREKAQEL